MRPLEKFLCLDRRGRRLLVAVRRVPISYSLKNSQYRVEAAGIGKLSVDAMPNAECCKMPNLVWYKPLVTLADRKVGFTERAFYSGGGLLPR